MCKSEDYFVRYSNQSIKIFSKAAALKELYATDIGTIQNIRLQNMMEKLLPYNLEFKAPAMEQNDVSSYAAQFPKKETVIEDFNISQPSIQQKSRRLMEKHFDMIDPEAERIAEVANEDIDYKRMMDHIRNRSPIETVEDSSELKQAEGIYNKLSIHEF